MESQGITKVNKLYKCPWVTLNTSTVGETGCDLCKGLLCRGKSSLIQTEFGIPASLNLVGN